MGQTAGFALINLAGRWDTPEDLQGAVVFLATDAAAYVHGVVLPIDGGWLAW